MIDEGIEMNGSSLKYFTTDNFIGVGLYTYMLMISIVLNSSLDWYRTVTLLLKSYQMKISLCEICIAKYYKSIVKFELQITAFNYLYIQLFLEIPLVQT